MSFIFKILEKMGRKYAYVDFFGDVLFYRYYPFFFDMKDHEDDRWLAKLPNMYIHHYPGNPEGEGPDGDNPHAHPWTTVGFLIKGKYKELINSSIVRDTNQFGFAYLKYRDYHQLTHVEPGTVSLFFHGFRRARWRLHLKKCEVLCDVCKEKNISCMKPDDQKVDLQEYLGATNKDGWRATIFLKCDKNFNDIITKRKEALAKLGITQATTMSMKKDALKKHIYRTIRHETLS